MARFTINLYRKDERVLQIEIVGKKHDSEHYYCHKNQYGIVWVIPNSNDISIDNKKAKGEFKELPYYDKMKIYKN